METVPIILGVIRVLVSLSKIGFLVWIYARTKVPAAVIYAAYLVLSSVLGRLISNFIISATAGSGNPARSGVTMNSLFAFGIVVALIETGLFIWLIQSLLNRSTPRDGR